MERANIADVVSDFVALKRRGANFVACCPFHNEKTPSFYVSASKGIYKCFGCGKSGNAVTFLMEHEQMSYTDAIKYIGNKYNITVEEKIETPQEREKLQRRESLLIVTDFAQKYFSNALTNSQEGQSVGLEYFKERQIEEQAIKDFALGYADASKDSFTKEALAKGYDIEFLLETGLTKGSQESGYYDGYRERVIFPIRDIGGRIVAFGGRKLRSDNNLAKYINSPESQIYIKNKTLYGLFEAKKHIEKNNCCYLVEGYTDVISMAQRGVRNIVASCGTSLTQGQIQLIKRFTNNIVVLYDGDSAGIHASLRGIDMFLAEEFNVKVILLPDGEDPDSFAKSHTQSELKEFLKKSGEDFISFKCRLANGTQMQESPIEKAQFIKEISNSIAVVPDAVLRNLYSVQVAQTLSIPIEVLEEQVDSLRRELRREQERQRRTKSGKLEGETTDEQYVNPQKLSADEFNYLSQASSPLFKYEREIIYYLLKYGKEPVGSEGINVAQFIRASFECDSLELENPSFRAVYNEYFTLDSAKADDAVRHFSLKTGEDNLISKSIISIFDEKYNIRSNKVKGSLIDEKHLLDKDVPQLIYRYKAEVCAIRVRELMNQMNSAEKSGDSDSATELMRKIGNLNGIKIKFLQLAKNKQ